MKFKKTTVVLLVSMLASCSSNRPITVSNSAVEFTQKLRHSTQAIGDKYVGSGAKAITKMIDNVISKDKNIQESTDEKLITRSDFTAYRANWITNNKKVVDINSFKALYSNLCRKKGGSSVNGACLNNSNDVIFYSKIEASEYQYNPIAGKRVSARVSILEHTGNIKSSVYKEALRRAGYRSQADNVVATRNLVRRLYAEKKNKERELPQIKRIGSKICMVKSGVNYIGYVERVAGNKVQIRVSQAHYVSARTLSPGGFREHIIWDNPSNWNLCR